MSKSKKILKVLLDMIKDGIINMLVFIGMFIVLFTIVVLAFSPTVICTLIFGDKVGAWVLFANLGIPISWILIVDITASFKRRMSRYE